MYNFNIYINKSLIIYKTICNFNKLKKFFITLIEKLVSFYEYLLEILTEVNEGIHLKQNHLLS